MADEYLFENSSRDHLKLFAQAAERGFAQLVLIVCQSVRVTISVTLLMTIAMICSSAVVAQQRAVPRPPDLADLSLEELMSVEVTSVSKHEQHIMEAPAAIYVITPEDIRRSGATSIPELLRMVPGLQVAKINANKWAITSRGSNSEFSNKLLVLIDGRSVYTPLFGGVYWNVQDMMLEDIERIEVIRGPGAALWGANAVNGVINVITRKASDTQGGMITAGAGNQERGFGSIRYGNKIGSRAFYRVYAKYFDRSASFGEGSKGAADGWDVLRGGFRLDWSISKADSLTIQGDTYRGDIGQRVTQTLAVPPFLAKLDDRFRSEGGDVLTRWNRVLSPKSALSLQFYYDRTSNNQTLQGETRNTFDFDFQHNFELHRNQIVWGIGLRTTSDDLTSSFTLIVDPSSRTTSLFNLFVQDEITLVNNRLRLTVGSKFEHNAYTGWDAQPSVRLVWTPQKEHSLWAAISHANRTPSRVERDMRVNISISPGMNGLPTYISLFGNPAFKSEQLDAYEAGYRFQPTKSVFLRVTAFLNQYEQLSRTLAGAPFFESVPQPAHLVIPILLDNGGTSTTTGIEAAADWAVTTRWKLAAGYTWFEAKSQKDATASLGTLGDSPRNQFNVRSFLNLSNKFEFDAAIYYVDRLPALAVPRYLRTDLRFGWHVLEALDLSFTGQNIFDKSHIEFGGSVLDFGSSGIPVPRSVYGKLTWRF